MSTSTPIRPGVPPAPAPLVDDQFPMEAVRHLAAKSCGCQGTRPELERNAHWPSCMVGRAQAFLGKRVSWECVGRPAHHSTRP